MHANTSGDRAAVAAAAASQQRHDVASLLDWMSSTDIELAQYAGWVIARLHQPNVIPELIQIVLNGEPLAQALAAHVLVTFGDAALNDLLAGLEDVAPVRVPRVAWTIGRIGAPEASTAIVERILRQSGVERRDLALALARCADHAHVGALLTLARDDDPVVRMAAALGLSNVASDEASAATRKVLADTALDAHWIERFTVRSGREREQLFGELLGLTSADAMIRADAAQALMAYPTLDAVPALIPALRDPHAEVRATAALALCSRAEVRSHAESVAALYAAVGDEDPWVRACVARALNSHSEPLAHLGLAHLLSDPDHDVRDAVTSATTVAYYPRSGRAQAFLPLLDHPDEDVRRRALTVLRHAGDRAARERLVAVTLNGQESLAVRRTAARALQSVSAHGHAPALLALLETLVASDDYRFTELASELISVLADARDDGIRAKLITLADAERSQRSRVLRRDALRAFQTPTRSQMARDDRDMWDLRDSDPYVFGDVAHRIGVYERGQAGEHIACELDRRSAYAREQALWALGRIQDLRYVPQLLAHLRDSARIARRAALHALQGLGDAALALSLAWLSDPIHGTPRRFQRHPRAGVIERHGPLLLTMLSDSSDSVRSGAAAALGNFGASWSFTSLRAAANDGSARVRDSANDALDELHASTTDTVTIEQRARLGDGPFSECWQPSGVYWNPNRTLLAVTSSRNHLNRRGRQFKRVRQHQRICVYDATTLKLVAQYDDVPMTIRDIAFHPREPHLVAGFGEYDGGWNYYGGVCVWDFASGAAVLPLAWDGDASHALSVVTCTYAADGATLNLVVRPWTSADEDETGVHFYSTELTLPAQGLPQHASIEIPELARTPIFGYPGRNRVDAPDTRATAAVQAMCAAAQQAGMDFAPRWFVFDIAWPEPKRVLATHARALLEQWDTAGTLISTVVTEFEGRQLFVTSDRQRVLVTSADRPRWRGHRRWDWRAQLDCVSLDNGSRERIDAGQGTRVVSMSNDGHLLARNPAHHRSDQNTTDTDRYFVMAPDGHVVGAPAISNGGGVRRSEDLRIDGGPDLYVVAVEESSVSGRLSEYVGDQLCAIEPATLSVRTLFPVEWDPYRNTVVAAHAGLYVADADGQAIVLACEVSAGSALPLRHGQRALVRRALPDGDALWAMPFDSEISALIEMRDLDAIAFATIEGLLGAVDRATGDLLCCERFVADGVPCTGLSLAAWGTQLAVGTLDGRIFLYDAQRIRGAP